jgi:hypothetical protein
MKLKRYVAQEVDTAEEELSRTRTLFENKMAEFQVI